MAKLPAVFDADAGLTFRAVLEKAGTVYSVSAAAWVAPVAVDWNNYAVTYTESAEWPGCYTGDVPAGLENETFDIIVQSRAGATLVVGDTIKYTGTYNATVNVGTIKGVDADTAIAAGVDASQAAKVSDAMTLTAGERTSIGTAVWVSTTRTLSGTSGGVGPTAATSDCDIYATAFKNGTARLCARVYKDGADIKQADVSTIGYSVYLLDDQNPDTRTAVTGHSAVALAAADVIYDTLQSDSQASDYNFKHIVPIGVSPAFAIAGRNYLAEYTITPTAGEKIIVRFVVRAI